MSEANHTKGPWETWKPQEDKVNGGEYRQLRGGMGWLGDIRSNTAEEDANGCLIIRAREVPHECNDPNCPGNVNRRKLAAFDGLLEACKKALEPGNREHLGFSARAQLEAAIAQAEGE